MRAYGDSSIVISSFLGLFMNTWGLCPFFMLTFSETRLARRSAEAASGLQSRKSGSLAYESRTDLAAQ
jgi:hypothetical protein